MTHSAPDARTPRPTADYRWTPDKARAFIQALAQHGKVAAAARAVGMTRQSAYRLKQRVPQLAEAWAHARVKGQARRARGSLRKASPWAPQGDTFGSQGDGFGRRDGTFAPQGDGFRPQGDGFGL